MKVLFVFDGTALTSGCERGEWIAMFWRAVITEGKGGRRDYDCWYQEGEGGDHEGFQTWQGKSGDDVSYRLIRQQGQGDAVLQVIGGPRAQEQLQ
ncbi:hypothetical protein [Vogesella sp. LIG4]|uniref:hypothetical protein n=1 Tax=Vogesella sp. LIG4 TaxID=1192162 RepID=UPI000B5ADCB2|nr:hypothetical protein [Vogesella sp. LIG4]